MDPDFDDEFDQILHVTGTGKDVPHFEEKVRVEKKAGKSTSRSGERAENGPTNRRKNNRAANSKKMADFKKQEAEIFSHDFNLAKAKTIKHENFDNTNAKFRKGH